VNDTKKCAKCGLVKLKAEYNSHKGRPDGFASRCRPCSKEDSRAAYKKDPSGMLLRAKGYRDADPERNRLNARNFRERNRDKWSKEEPDRDGEKACTKCKHNKPKLNFYKVETRRDGLDTWCAPCRNAGNKAVRDADPERARERSRNYWRAHPELKSRLRAAYNAAKLQRDFTHWDRELSDLVWEELFLKRRWLEEKTGVRWSVDHEAPLRGDLVSGLHVWNNWRLVTFSANSAKKNRFDPDTFSDRSSAGTAGTTLF
jgi:hypothetical protein